MNKNFGLERLQNYVREISDGFLHYRVYDWKFTELYIINYKY